MIVYTANEYRTFLRQQLGQISPYVIREIQNMLTTYVCYETLMLKVEIISDQLDRSLPLRATLLNGESEIEAWDLARQVPHVLAPEDLAELERFDQAGVEVSAVTLQTLLEWFANCWELAANTNCRFPCQVNIRDDIEAFDVNQREWVPKKRKAPPRKLRGIF